MPKKCIIAMFNIKPGADPGIAANLKKFLLEEFIPAEKEAPGLISIELIERFRDPVPHEPDNKASDIAFVEFWEDVESNHDWWAGNMFAPKSENMKKAMNKFKAFLESPEGANVELIDCHYTVAK